MGNLVSWIDGWAGASRNREWGCKASYSPLATSNALNLKDEMRKARILLKIFCLEPDVGTPRKRPAVLRVSMLLLGLMTMSFTVIASATSSSLNAGAKTWYSGMSLPGMSRPPSSTGSATTPSISKSPSLHGKVILVRRALQWRSLLHSPPKWARHSSFSESIVRIITGSPWEWYDTKGVFHGLPFLNASCRLLQRTIRGPQMVWIFAAPALFDSRSCLPKLDGGQIMNRSPMVLKAWIALLTPQWHAQMRVEKSNLQTPPFPHGTAMPKLLRRK